jgi:hypothetical protein
VDNGDVVRVGIHQACDVTVEGVLLESTRKRGIFVGPLHGDGMSDAGDCAWPCDRKAAKECFKAHGCM